MTVTEGVSSLYDIDLYMVGGPLLHFCSLADYQRTISRGGVTYTPIPMEAQGFEYRGTGALPQPTVIISNLYGAMNVLFANYGELLGVPITRIRILARWLDDGATPDPTAELGRDTFVIAQKTSHTAMAVTFKLAWRMDQEGTVLPRRLVLRDICTHIYRRWTGSAFDYALATCPYTGAAMFDTANAPTSDGSQDQCSRRLSGCKLRFPGQALPTRAFPAVGRIR
jgi:lambda family phage minor tail protein L